MTRATWHSSQGESRYAKDLNPGDVIAVDYAPMRHKPWVVQSVNAREDRHALILRPLGEQFDFAQFNESIGMSQWAQVHVLPEHYSVCSRCGDLPPCSEVWSGRVVDAASERAARYETEGVCPACQEPITRRQHAHRFEENLYVPLGPPVTFHTRNRCVSSAVQYDIDVAKSTDREPRLSCEGMHVHHRDDTFACTNVTCPGMVRHRSYARCWVLNAKCIRPECWDTAQAQFSLTAKGSPAGSESTG